MSKQHIIHFTGPINSSTCGNLINTCAKVLQQEAEELRINILPAIESVLAQGILCTEGVYLTAVFLLASRPPLPCASIEGATRKRS